MAKAYQCDRCMQYYTENKEIPIGATDNVLSGIAYKIRRPGLDVAWRTAREFELCDECLKKIKDFMEFKADFVPKTKE